MTSMKVVSLLLVASMMGAVYMEKSDCRKRSTGFLTPEQQATYGKLLNFATLGKKDSSVSRLLQGAALPNVRKIQEFSVHRMMDMIRNDPVKGKIAQERLLEYGKKQRAVRMDQVRLLIG